MTATENDKNVWSLAFVIGVEPQPWQRATPTGKGRVFSNNSSYQDKVGWAAKAGMLPLHLGLTTHPLILAARFYFSPPPSWSKAKRASAFANEIAAIQRADLDNYLKNLCDGLTGVAYRDDRQIVATDLAMMWTTATPRTDVRLTAWTPASAAWPLR